MITIGFCNYDLSHAQHNLLCRPVMPHTQDDCMSEPAPVSAATCGQGVQSTRLQCRGEEGEDKEAGSKTSSPC